MGTIDNDAVQRKRKYPNLDALILDDDFRKHVAMYETGDPEPLLTIGIALLRDDWEAPAGLVRSLEENLSIFLPPLSVQQRRSLAANLLNGRVQFLNTVSELGLARHYRDLSWQVRLAEPLPTGKDVDLFMAQSGQERWLDVINAAPSEWEGAGFAPLVPNDFEMRLVEKVVDKFQTKFREAIDAGWTGSAWVALDFTKNDAILLAVTVQNLNLIDCKSLDAFASDVLRRCPGLSGVVYYTYDAREPKASWVREYKCP